MKNKLKTKRMGTQGCLKVHREYTRRSQEQKKKKNTNHPLTLNYTYQNSFKSKPSQKVK